MCCEYRKKEAVAAQAVKGPSVEGVRLGAGAGNDLFERLELLVPCEEDRGLATIIDMSRVYRCWRRQSAQLRVWRSSIRSVASCYAEYNLVGERRRRSNEGLTQMSDQVSSATAQLRVRLEQAQSASNMYVGGSWRLFLPWYTRPSYTCNRLRGR